MYGKTQTQDRSSSPLTPQRKSPASSTMTPRSHTAQTLARLDIANEKIISPPQKRKPTADSVPHVQSVPVHETTITPTKKVRMSTVAAETDILSGGNQQLQSLRNSPAKTSSDNMSVAPRVPSSSPPKRSTTISEQPNTPSVQRGSKRVQETQRDYAYDWIKQALTRKHLFSRLAAHGIDFREELMNTPEFIVWLEDAAPPSYATDAEKERIVTHFEKLTVKLFLPSLCLI